MSKTDKTARNIKLDGNVRGYTYEGISGIFASNVHRYFPLYPDKQRNQMLDLMFKPQFGMSLTGFKMEVGGDGNASCGSEPCMIRTREEYEDAIAHIDDPDYEPNKIRFSRGWQFQTAADAKKRNPDIEFECLQWSAPAWVRGKNLTDCLTTENIDFLVAIIRGAKTYWGIDIKYVAGDMNEWTYSKEYVLNLRRTLDDNGLSHVKIVVTDLFEDCPPGESAREAHEELNNPEFAAAVHAIGTHYWGYEYFNEDHDKTRVWKGEDGFWLDPFWEAPDAGKPYGSIKNALSTAGILNKNYIQYTYTRDCICNLLIAMADCMFASDGQGYLFAPEPWSGHYQFFPNAWAVAYTTQFVKPGWVYLGSGCGELDGGGSYVAMADPESGDFSVIIHTGDVDVEQRIKFDAANLSTAEKHVWETYGTYDSIWFRHISHIEAGAFFELMLKPNAIYTITTTPWGHKGILDFTQPEDVNDPRRSGDIDLNSIPVSNPRFPHMPFYENFENHKIGKEAPYFTDFDGAFEIAEDGCAPGVTGFRCLEQKLKEIFVPWGQIIRVVGFSHEPKTYFGDSRWTDYRIKVDARIADSGGYLCIYGRTAQAAGEGYWLKVTKSGERALYVDAVELGEGKLPGFDAGEWHTYRMELSGNIIKVYIDGDEKPLAEATDGAYIRGAAALGSSFNKVRFGNLSVEPMDGYSEPPPFISEIDCANGSLRNDLNIKAGMKITVGSADIAVYELGRYIVRGNCAPHSLEIFDEDGGLVARTFVQARRASAENCWLYASLDIPEANATKVNKAAVLSSGKSYYIVSTEQHDGDYWHDDVSAISFNDGDASIDGRAVYDGGEWHVTTGGNCGLVNFK